MALIFFLKKKIDFLQKINIFLTKNTKIKINEIKKNPLKVTVGLRNALNITSESFVKETGIYLIKNIFNNRNINSASN